MAKWIRNPHLSRKPLRMARYISLEAGGRFVYFHLGSFVLMPNAGAQYNLMKG